MDSITLLGFAAAILTTAAFLPQTIKTWKSKSTKDISLGWSSMTCLGVLLWFTYGIYIKSAPVIIANLITFLLASMILALKIKYK